MELKDLVCDLEYAKRFRELGVPQESFFYWDWYSDTCYDVRFVPYSCPGLKRYSAFTAIEILNIFPLKMGFPIELIKVCVEGKVVYAMKLNHMLSSYSDENPANVLAKQLIDMIRDKRLD